MLATFNPGKVRELRELFGEIPFTVSGLRDFDDVGEVEETGSTFRENAEIKARAFASQTGQLCLADDSGLEVMALGGAPGVHSARFAGKETGYEVKIAKLLQELQNTNYPGRRARFVCVMALANTDGEILHIAEGVCDGHIAAEPRGVGGFGYDPIFIPDRYDATFAELGDEIKQQISHRGRAAQLIIRYLLDFIAV